MYTKKNGDEINNFCCILYQFCALQTISWRYIRYLWDKRLKGQSIFAPRAIPLCVKLCWCVVIASWKLLQSRVDNLTVATNFWCPLGQTSIYSSRTHTQQTTALHNNQRRKHIHSSIKKNTTINTALVSSTLNTKRHNQNDMKHITAVPGTPACRDTAVYVRTYCLLCTVTTYPGR